MYDYLIDIAILGSEHVGKKTLAKSKFLDSFGDQDFMLTIGMIFSNKTVKIDQTIVKLCIRIFSDKQYWWDNTRRGPLGMNMSGSHGAIILYDITNAKSLKRGPQWIQIVKDNARDIPILLVGNKLDLEEQREVSKEQAEEIKNKHSLASVMEISVKTEENLEKMISTLTDLIMLDKMRSSFVRSINSAISTEKFKLEGKKNLKKRQKFWRILTSGRDTSVRHYVAVTKTFEDFLKKQKEKIVNLEEMKISLRNAKELVDLLEVWEKAKRILNP